MNKNAAVPKDVDAYIAGFPEEIQDLLRKIRKAIKREAPDAEESIRYGMPGFTLNGPLVYFAAYKKHIGMYPAPKGTERFNRELSPYRGAKSSVRFPMDKPIPFDLIRQMVKLRIKENAKRAKMRGKK